MGYVLRTWQCLSPRCSKEFESGDEHPICAHCGSFKVQWIPRGGHVGKVAKQFDSVLKGQAERYGLTNLNSAKAGERAAPALATGQELKHTPRWTPGPGFGSIPLSTQAAAHFVGSDIPLTGRLPTQRAFRSPGRSSRIPTQVVGRHDGKIA